MDINLRSQNKKTFSNKVYVKKDTLKENIELEVNYIKNNEIFFKKLHIKLINIDAVLQKFKSRGFNIIMIEQNHSDYQNISNNDINKIVKEQITNSNNPLIKNDFIRNCYSESFRQNYR